MYRMSRMYRMYKIYKMYRMYRPIEVLLVGYRNRICTLGSL